MATQYQSVSGTDEGKQEGYQYTANLFFERMKKNIDINKEKDPYLLDYAIFIPEDDVKIYKQMADHYKFSWYAHSYYSSVKYKIFRKKVVTLFKEAGMLATWKYIKKFDHCSDSNGYLLKVDFSKDYSKGGLLDCFDYLFYC